MSVGAKDHEIIEMLAGKLDRAVDQIVEARGAFGHAKTNGSWLRTARGHLVRRQTETGTVVSEGAAFGLGSFAFGLEQFGSAETVVRVAVGDEAFGTRTIAVEALRLKVGRVGTIDSGTFIP